MRMYGLVNLGSGCLLGLLAMVLSLTRMGDGRSALPICMALSSVALFVGGAVFYVAGCCQAQAPEAEEPKARKSK